ncbi:hypothetical protein [Longibacter sp.]|uniref:hypothetical protein n=1 Tax=Longibacter sp. TaxID=2045415 RepID=UPI003EBEC83C
MMRTVLLSLGLTTVLFLFPACSASSPDAPAVLGSTTMDGSGTPNGRTNPSNAMELPGVSDDPNYGTTRENPIKVGGSSKDQVLYLNALRGPNGEPIRYERQGHCCPYQTKNGIMGTGMLDVYAVTYTGLDEPNILYLTFYDYEQPMAPAGYSYVGQDAP